MTTRRGRVPSSAFTNRDEWPSKTFTTCESSTSMPGSDNVCSVECEGSRFTVCENGSEPLGKGADFALCSTKVPAPLQGNITRPLLRVGLRGGKGISYTPEQKLDARTVKGASCWLVEGAATRDGYVQVANVYAHRIAFARVHGPIPAGLLVLHRCDTPRCVNPDHLFLGTQADNMRDCVTKGRHVSNRRHEFGLEPTHAGFKALQQVGHVHEQGRDADGRRLNTRKRVG